LPALAAQLRSDESKVPKLRQELTEIARKVAEASEGAKGNDASAAAGALMDIVSSLDRVHTKVSASNLSAEAKSDVLMRLEEKREQAEAALNEALNVNLEAVVVPQAEGRGAKELAKEADAMTTVSPGQDFFVAVDFHNGSKDRLSVEGLKLEVPEGWGTSSNETKQLESHR
jgi:hypothetical protein